MGIFAQGSSVFVNWSELAELLAGVKNLPRQFC